MGCSPCEDDLCIVFVMSSYGCSVIFRVFYDHQEMPFLRTAQNSDYVYPSPQPSPPPVTVGLPLYSDII